MVIQKAQPWLLALCSSLWIGLCFLTLDSWPLSLLAWVGFVPILFATEGRRWKDVYRLTLLFAFFAQAIGTYWAIDMFVHMKGAGYLQATFFAIIGWLYTAHVFVAIFLTQEWLATRLAISRLVLFPVVATILFWLWPLLFPISISETQFNLQILILPISITGEWGLNALIFMVNAVICEWLKGRLTRTQLLTAVTVSVLWLGTGLVLKTQSKETAAETQNLFVGLIQPNSSSDASGNKIEGGYVRSHRIDMELGEKLLAKSDQKIDLVVWPEGRVKHFRHDEIANKAIRNFADMHNVWLMFQDSSKNSAGVYNQSIMLDSDGRERHKHNKAKPMPFGEYMPFGDYLPDGGKSARRLLTRLDSNFEAGEAFSTWRVNDLISDLTIMPMICYENLFSMDIARAIPNKIGKYLMVSQSNDVWFGETIQPFMHGRKAGMRAVENGIVMVNSVQNGPSSVYLPDATTYFQTQAYEAGAYRIGVPIKRSRPSFYSRHPQVFIYSLFFVFLAFVLSALCSKPQQNKSL